MYTLCISGFEVSSDSSLFCAITSIKQARESHKEMEITTYTLSEREYVSEIEDQPQMAEDSPTK